ncbi:uncharacterized protein [Procambarus clarkii]|uniref:uncharacterized protein n=1 Tax=Procambarus clarkii TaxID=6728 RepID=UPI0037438569
MRRLRSDRTASFSTLALGCTCGLAVAPARRKSRAWRWQPTTWRRKDIPNGGAYNVWLRKRNRLYLKHTSRRGRSPKNNLVSGRVFTQRQMSAEGGSDCLPYCDVRCFDRWYCL